MRNMAVNLTKATEWMVTPKICWEAITPQV